MIYLLMSFLLSHSLFILNWGSLSPKLKQSKMQEGLGETRGEGGERLLSLPSPSPLLQIPPYALMFVYDSFIRSVLSYSNSR